MIKRLDIEKKDMRIEIGQLTMLTIETILKTEEKRLGTNQDQKEQRN